MYLCSGGVEGVRVEGIGGEGVGGGGARDSCCPKLGERWKAGSGAVMLQ